MDRGAWRATAHGVTKSRTDTTEPLWTAQHSMAPDSKLCSLNIIAILHYSYKEEGRGGDWEQEEEEEGRKKKHGGREEERNREKEEKRKERRKGRGGKTTGREVSLFLHPSVMMEEKLEQDLWVCHSHKKRDSLEKREASKKAREAAFPDHWWCINDCTYIVSLAEEANTQEPLWPVVCHMVTWAAELKFKLRSIFLSYSLSPHVTNLKHSPTTKMENSIWEFFTWLVFFWVCYLAKQGW